MEKVDWKEAVKIERDLGAYTIHIGYMPELQEKHPDCAAVVIDATKHWSDPTSRMYLILDNPDMEASVGGFYTRLANR